MTLHTVSIDLAKTYEVLRILESELDNNDLSSSLKKASALREASRYLRSVSQRNRQIAEETREVGRQLAQANLIG